MLAQISMLCTFIRLYGVTYVKIQFNHSKFSKFISSWKMFEKTFKLCRRFFLHKTNKKTAKRTRSEMFCTFAGMTSLSLNWIICNFMILWNLTKMPQNFVQSSFSIKLKKKCYKNRGNVLASVRGLNKEFLKGPSQNCNFVSFYFLFFLVFFAPRSIFERLLLTQI